MKHFFIPFLYIMTHHLFADAIKGGTFVPITNHPYVAQLELSSEKGKEFCAGAIVSRVLILTAPHCLTEKADGKKENVRVRVGGTNANSGEVVNVEEIIINNVTAMVKLATPIQLNEYKQIIQVSEVEPPVGSEVLALGFGDRFGNLLVLQKVETKVTENLSHGKYAVEYAGLCTGDEGGPVIYNNELAGIVDRGCPPPGTPSNVVRVHVPVPYDDEKSQQNL